MSKFKENVHRTAQFSQCQRWQLSFGQDFQVMLGSNTAHGGIGTC